MKLLRESVVLILAKCIVLAALTDLLFLLAYLSISKIQFLEAFHHHTIILFVLLELIKTTIQITVMLTLILKWFSTHYHIAGKRLVKQQGVFNLKEEAYNLEDIQSVSLNQSLWGRILQYGDLEIVFRSETGQDRLSLTGIAQPDKQKELITGLLAESS